MGRLPDDALWDLRLVRCSDKNIPFLVKKSNKKKKIGVLINNLGIIEISAPEGISDVDIKDVVLRNRNLIEKKWQENMGRESEQNSQSGPVPGMRFIRCDGKDVPYTITRNSQRETVEVRLRSDGSIRVEVPVDTDDADIMLALLDGRDWIASKLRERRIRDEMTKSSSAGILNTQFVKCGDQKVPYTITKSSRRTTITLVLHLDGSAELRAPVDADDDEILEHLLKCRDWITSKLREQSVKAGKIKLPDDLPPEKQFVRCGDEDVRYTVTRSYRRKTMGLVLHPNDRIEVKAPVNVSSSIIMDYVLKNKDWITSKLREQRIRAGKIKPPADLPPKKQFVRCGDEDVRYTVTRSYRRKTVGLTLHPRGKLEIKAPGEMDGATIKTYVVQRRDWIASKLKEQRVRESKDRLPIRRTVESIIKRTMDLAEWMQLPAPSVSVREMRSAWGRCSGSDDIVLHAALAKMPEPVADYVIIHELCHILIPGHTRQYWATVAKYCPEYVRHKRWIKENTPALLL